MCFNNNETGDEVETERQVFGSSEQDEFRVGDTTGNANNLIQISQQQPPLAPVVKWERYLPVRSLKVLLLSCIDLVLTEVVMPVQSGTCLLSKITSHKTLKNIPVIMMSSHDSMVLVFKCLSNGAVDFLVKPIRKNELKNLWQHVWRRCHSLLCGLCSYFLFMSFFIYQSSGSGSESAIQNKKPVKTESSEGSENDASISDEDQGNENGSNGLGDRDGGSDTGSGTQSSWTKRAGDINSISPSYQFPDGTNMNPGTNGNRLDDVNKLKEIEDQNEQIGMGSQEGMFIGKKVEERGNHDKDAKNHVQALERNNDNSQVESKAPSSLPEDLPREAGDYRIGDQSVLRHSSHSAFSKYNNCATSACKAPEENVGSCSPHDSPIAKLIGSGSSSDNPLNQQSSGSERSAQREAALMKFRLKRKERCFEKKVRYHSRKKLAEQRPRVKGQFIRKRDDTKSGSECPSSDDS
ncbi:hypothetical protein CARUB_v10026357mg [Capsella rubella]|uniref:CCT domain-containing protein n=1 Tax=Capsella rubella TaxID=81985 RepID=R0EVX3_9BRAS|nr:hypothetical protein CARUB_v10026357mg [Capsella rubella]